MEPRTKLQREVLSLSKSLHPIDKKQKKWAFKNCLEHIGYRNKSNTFCLDCGYIWNGSQKSKSLVCPGCSTKLKIEDTKKKKLIQRRLSMAIIDVVGGFQLVRIFEINSHHKAGFPAEYSIWEVVQQWFRPDDKLTIVARTCSFGNYGWGGDLEIRTNLSNYYHSNKYDLYVDKIHPVIKLLPLYQRNGFTAKVDYIHPYSLFNLICNESKAETLIKAGQYSLLRLISGNGSSLIYRYWDSIKICIRQGYLVKDAKTWIDYLELLSFFRKDLRSPKYVCTKTLKNDHDRFVLKKRLHDKREDDIRRRKKIADQEKHYSRDKARFFGLLFEEGNITIKVLESVKEFIEEGDYHQHCVYTNEYYSKPDSLCFSAKVNGIPTETVEVSLSKLKVEQSRGLRNDPTEHHKQIVELINKNLHQIKSRILKKVRKSNVQQIGVVA